METSNKLNEILCFVAEYFNITLSEIRGVNKNNQLTSYRKIFIMMSDSIINVEPQILTSMLNRDRSFYFRSRNACESELKEMLDTVKNAYDLSKIIIDDLIINDSIVDILKSNTSYEKRKELVFLEMYK